MKLRIYGDSIRLRLRQPEVRALLEEAFVEQSTAFSAGVELKYRLELGGEAVRASFDARQLRVSIPRELAKRWASTDEVGITADQFVEEGRSLRILIEKDFACKDGGNGESQEGAFENPEGSGKC
jgi:hypothetical protein